MFTSLKKIKKMNSYETPPNTEGQVETEAVKSTFFQKFGEYMSRWKEDPARQELNEKTWDILARDTVLALLVGAEFVPGLELANEGTKLISILKTVKNHKGKIKKGGKGLLFDLYPDIPKSLVSVFGMLDTVGVPIVGAAPEIAQIGVDVVNLAGMRVKGWASDVKLAKEVFAKKADLTTEAREAFEQRH
jgi:hypothetical protein